MQHVSFRGYTFDPVTPAAIRWAEKKLGFQLRIVQGSYNTTVKASAGTHDKGGCFDASVKGMTPERIAATVKALRDAGFAAWHRTVSQGFSSDHIHAVLIGCPDLAPIAARQVQSFDAHRDGLKSNLPDNTYHPNPPVQFDLAHGGPVPRGGKTPNPQPGPKPTPTK